MAGLVKAQQLPQLSATLQLANARATTGNDAAVSCDGFNGLQAVEIQITGAPTSSTNPNCQLYLEGQFANSGSIWYPIGFLQRDNQATPLRYVPPIYFINPTIAAPTITPSASGGKLGAGTYYYAITYAAMAPVSESVIGTASASTGALSGSANSVALSVIPTGPTGTAVRNIYRSSVANTGPWTLVGVVADNITASWTDYGTATPGAAPPTAWNHVYYLDDAYTSVRLRLAGVSGTLSVSSWLYLLPV